MFHSVFLHSALLRVNIIVELVRTYLTLQFHCIMANEQLYAVGELWDKIDSRIETARDEALEATEKILSIAEDTKRIGASTLIELNQQGEKLQSIQRKEDDIEEDVKYTKQLLRTLGCHFCWCPSIASLNKFDLKKVCTSTLWL